MRLETLPSMMAHILCHCIVEYNDSVVGQFDLTPLAMIPVSCGVPPSAGRVQGVYRSLIRKDRYSAQSVSSENVLVPSASTSSDQANIPFPSETWIPDVKW